MANKSSAPIASTGSALLSGVGSLRPPKLSHMVADRLRNQIVSGQVAVGSTLPPENELLSIFEVSRPILREALRILEAEALIKIGRGVRTGAVVCGANLDKVADYASVLLASEGVTMLDLHEARTFFEPAIIFALARLSREVGDEAVRAVNEVVTELDTNLAAKDYVAVVKGTQAFHRALARLSGNRTIAVFVGILHTISDDVYATTLLQEGNSPSPATQKNMKKTVDGYHVLVDLLSKRKFEEAGAFWQRYMERARDFLETSKLGRKKILHQGAHGGKRD